MNWKGAAGSYKRYLFEPQWRFFRVEWTLVTGDFVILDETTGLLLVDCNNSWKELKTIRQASESPSVG